MIELQNNITRITLDEIVEELAESSVDQKVDLTGKNIIGIDLRGLDIKNFNFEDEKVDIESCIIDKAQIEYLSRIGRKNFSKIIVKNQDFGLNYTCFKELGIAFNQGFYLEDANLTNSIFIDCNFDQATFKNCILNNIVFENCINIDKAKAINCIQEGTHIPIPEYIPSSKSSKNFLLSFVSKIVSLSFLSNMLGDG